MKLAIVHDSDGVIVSLAASPPDAPVAYQDPGAGERLSEIDAPELTTDMDVWEVHERLADMVENYRIDVEGSARLIRN